MNHLLLTDLTGERMIAPADFMFAFRQMVDIPEELNVVGKSTKKTISRKRDATILVVHDELRLLVQETPEEIYALLGELDYEATYTEPSYSDNEE